MIIEPSAWAEEDRNSRRINIIFIVLEQQIDQSADVTRVALFFKFTLPLINTY